MVQEEPPRVVQVEALRERMQFLSTERFWKHEFRQAQALEHVVAEPRRIVVAKDKPNSLRAAREYYGATLRSLFDTMVTVPRQMRNYYELITDTRPCHLYIDFEYYPDCNADDAEHPFATRRALVLRLVLAEIGKVCSATRVSVFECDASKRSKCSRHYVLHVHGHMFADQFQCGAIQRRVQLAAMKKHGPAEANPYFAWTVPADHVSRATDGAARPLPVMDHAVYTRSRIFRVPWATKYKPGELRPLLPVAQWDAYRAKDSAVWHNATGECANDHGLPGGMDMCSCECERYEKEKMQEPNWDLFIEGLVQAQSERFLETCEDGECKLIRTTEPDGRPAFSSTQLMNAVTQGRAVARRGLGDVAAPDMLTHAFSGDSTLVRPSEIDMRVLEAQYGEAANISAQQAAMIRSAAPIRVSRNHDSEDAAEDPTQQAENLELFLAAFADNETFARESARLCVAAIDEICELRKSLPVVTGHEAVSYIRNYGPSLTFSYQLKSGFCSLCSYEHSSNHVKVVVQLSPHTKYCDESHPGAPVFYFKCYKRPDAHTPPRALPSYVNSADVRARIDALCAHVQQTFMIKPREFLAYLLQAPAMIS